MAKKLTVKLEKTEPVGAAAPAATAAAPAAGAAPALAISAVGAGVNFSGLKTGACN